MIQSFGQVRRYRPGKTVQDERKRRNDASGADLRADDAARVGQLARGEIAEAAPDVGAKTVAQTEGGNQER